MYGQADACRLIREVEVQVENIGSEWKLGCNNSSVGSGCARKFGMRRSLVAAPDAMCGLSQCRCQREIPVDRRLLRRSPVLIIEGN